MLKKGSKKRKMPPEMMAPRNPVRLKYPMRNDPGWDSFIQPVFDRSAALLDGGEPESQPWFNAMRTEMSFS